MLKLPNIQNYVVIKDIKELYEAKKVDLCRYIIQERTDSIVIWHLHNRDWVKSRYALSGKVEDNTDETTGFDAYQSFYNYAGREEVEKMKHILSPIALWESYEQKHFANYNFAEQKIYQPIYVFDANSSFTYGAMQLPKGFETLKDYMSILYDKKKNTTNKSIRTKYKNLQNYLVGYFARIKDFIRVRSDIIKESNYNITRKMIEINKAGGNVYLSNTDSIITDSIGAEIMDKYIGEEVGQFKLELTADKLFYKSPNAYQVGDKLVYSGVSYYARKHTDFFQDKYAIQEGSFVKPFDFVIETEDESERKLCRVELGSIIVNVFNKIGEKLETYVYEL